MHNIAEGIKTLVGSKVMINKLKDNLFDKKDQYNNAVDNLDKTIKVKLEELDVQNKEPEKPTN